MPDGLASRVMVCETWKVPAGNSVMNAETSAAAGAASTSPPVSRMSTVTVRLLIAAGLMPKGRIDIERTYSLGGHHYKGPRSRHCAPEPGPAAARKFHWAAGAFRRPYRW